MIDSRERLIHALNFQQADRVPMIEISIWDETIERWRKEGLPGDVAYQSPFVSKNEYLLQNTVDDFLGLDRIAIVSFDCTLRFDEKLIEETDEFKIYTTQDGIQYKGFKNKTTPALPLDWTVKTSADWEIYKHRLVPDRIRLSQDTSDLCRTLAKNNIFTVVSPQEACQYALYLLGEKNCLELMALEPDFIEEFIKYYSDFTINMLEIILADGIKPDALWYFSDLCYKNGMLFSPVFYRERIMKYHKRVFDFCKSRGMKIIYHCDGYIGELLPLLIEAGIDCIQPMEARCGNDVRVYKKLYGDRIAFFGNISADILSTGKTQIEGEVREKLLAAKAGGGYIFHSDHSIPPTISFDNYCYSLELARKYGQYL